ncbi:19638_t:CDS:2, partial [Cetraspora pellucida]
IEAFKAGKSNIEDAPHFGHSCKAVTDSNIAKIKTLISDDPHITVEGIQHVVDISVGSIETILYTKLHAHKVCSKWVLHTLSEKNKQKKVKVSKQLLKYLDNGFQNIITVSRIVASIVVKEGHTVNRRYYGNDVLLLVFKNFKEISGRSTVRDIMLHHDNATPHKAKEVTEVLRKERVILLSHPPYSPDLALCDFFLFPKIKKELGGL